jgi:hypothetical protein
MVKRFKVEFFYAMLTSNLQRGWLLNVRRFKGLMFNRFKFEFVYAMRSYVHLFAL